MRRDVLFFIIGLLLSCRIVHVQGQILTNNMLSSEEYPIRSVWPLYGLNTEERFLWRNLAVVPPIHLDVRPIRSGVQDVNSSDIEQAKKSLLNDNYFIRCRILENLTYKFGEQTLFLIKNSIDDPHPQVRCTAAEMMALMDDTSGLEIIRKDIAQFTQKKQESESSTETQELPLGETTTKRKYSLRDAITAAHVLSEFSDSSGFDLAKEIALDSNNSNLLRRREAIEVLTELERTIDKATLKEQSIDPEAVLIEIAGSETEAKLLEYLSDLVMTNMKPTSQIRILEKLQKSPHVDEWEHRLIDSNLKRSRKQLALDEQENQNN